MTELFSESSSIRLCMIDPDVDVQAQALKACSQWCGLLGDDGAAAEGGRDARDPPVQTFDFRLFPEEVRNDDVF